MCALFSPESLRAGAVKGLIVTAMRLPLKRSALTVHLFNFLSFSSSFFCLFSGWGGRWGGRLVNFCDLIMLAMLFLLPSVLPRYIQLKMESTHSGMHIRAPPSL